MSCNDIFADYIQKVKSQRPYEPIQSTMASPDKGTVKNSEELSLLKEISNKIDDLKKDKDYGVEMDIAIVNGNIVVPDHGIIKENLYIKQGKVHSISSCGSIKAKRVIDAEGKHVLPGIIDPHIHLGIFAPLEKELQTETKSALLGGVTTVGCFIGGPDSHLKSFPKVVEEINKSSYVDIIPHLVIGNEEQRSEIREYVNNLNVTSFKLYMNGIPGLIPDVDDAFILDTFEELKKEDKQCILCVHSENRYLVRRATKMIEKQLGERATIVDWSDTHPEIGEEEAVIRLSYLAEQSKVPVYFVHISTAAAVNRLRQLKPFNKYINIETTSPYLSISRDELEGPIGKMEPPFRDRYDVEELWRALEDNVVDTIGTDNVTMTKEEKNITEGVWKAMPGYPAVATHLPVLLHEGVVKRGIPIEKLISQLTKKPAEIFGVYPQKGSILPGSDADVVIVDLSLEKKVDVQNLQSRSDFSLYEGKVLQGWPILTIKNGKIVAQNGELISRNAEGKVLTR